MRPSCSRARPKGLTQARNIPAWQLATFPSLPQYWRATPADFLPCLGKSLPSNTHTASGCPSLGARHSCNRPMTVSPDHRASVEKTLHRPCRRCPPIRRDSRRCAAPRPGPRGPEDSSGCAPATVYGRRRPQRRREIPESCRRPARSPPHPSPIPPIIIRPAILPLNQS